MAQTNRGEGEEEVIDPDERDLDALRDEFGNMVSKPEAAKRRRSKSTYYKPVAFKIQKPAKIRIINLDGSGERQFDQVPSLERTEGEKTWDLSVIQGYIVRKFDRVNPEDQEGKGDQGKWKDQGDDLVTA